MEADFLAVCTDGKVWVCSDPDQALAVANVSHVYEIAPVGHVAQLICTLSGTGSPYTITSAASATTSDGKIKVRK